MIQGNASWPTETSKGKTQEGQEETSFPSSAKLVSNSTRVYGDEITWDILNITTGWCFETMDFFDFPETVGNVIIPTDFHSIIFQGSRFTCFTCVTRKMGRWASTGSTMVGIRIGPIRRHKDHNRNLVGGLEHYFSYIGCLLPSGKATYCGWVSEMLHHQKDDWNILNHKIMGFLPPINWWSSLAHPQ